MACVLCLGSLESDDSSAAGDLPPTVKSIKWAYSTRPVYGWGDAGADQKATAGWLAALPVFEPHWQVPCLCIVEAVPPQKVWPACKKWLEEPQTVLTLSSWFWLVVEQTSALYSMPLSQVRVWSSTAPPW